MGKKIKVDKKSKIVEEDDSRVNPEKETESLTI